MAGKRVLRVKNVNNSSEVVDASLGEVPELSVHALQNSDDIPKDQESLDLLVVDDSSADGNHFDLIQKVRAVPNAAFVPIIVFSDSKESYEAGLRKAGVTAPFFILQIATSKEEFQNLLAQILEIEFPNSKIVAKPHVRFKADVDIINAFISSTVSTLVTMAKCEKVEVLSMSPLKAGEELRFDYWASIEIVSKFFDGEMGLGFSTETIKSIYSKIVGSEGAVDESAMPGAVGELANVIYGGTKQVLNSKGHLLEKALPILNLIPTIITFDKKNPIIVLKMRSDSGEFSLLIKAFERKD